MRIEEAVFVSEPNPRNANEKIVGNMTASKRKMAKSPIMEYLPKFISTTIVDKTQPQPQMNNIISGRT